VVPQPRATGVAPGPVKGPAPRLAEQFRQIFVSELDYVYNSLRRLGIPERDLPDVTHDTFVVVHRKLDQLDPARPVRPWLFGIAYRVASDHRMLCRNHREHLGVEAHPVSEAPTADEQLAAHEDRRLVTDALAALPLDRRAVIVMHEIDGIPIPDVADALGIPLNTAYSRLRIARRELEVAIKRLWLQRGLP
jgi:RNA polymerase sigma-70 factor (ECF subfamily)